MRIAFCYESVLPQRGGCETYIADIARRLAADGHELHLLACRWDPAALPGSIHYHPIPPVGGPRFLRPWRFGAACLSALRELEYDVSIGFDKTWGLDVLYPQGGLHAASATCNLNKHESGLSRGLARLTKALDLAHWSFSLLERRQYCRLPRPLIVVNSLMVERHFQHYYGLGSRDIRVVRSAIDPARFAMPERLRLRGEWRQTWQLADDHVVGLFVAMNYRLKGLEPLLRAFARISAQSGLRLLIAGNPKTAGCERLARRLNVIDRVRFLGPRRDVHHCYFAADFLVHPTFYDPCSLVALEALACGLPVITTSFNGASELLHSGRNGYVIAHPRDYQSLADSMRLMLDPLHRQECARAARVTASQWNFEHHYQRLMIVLQEAVLRKQAA